jgi:hypothetical protein
MCDNSLLSDELNLDARRSSWLPMNCSTPSKVNPEWKACTIIREVNVDDLVFSSTYCSPVLFCSFQNCSSKCECRYKAEDVNKQFVKFLDDYSLNAKTAELFKMVILDEYASDTLKNKEYKTYQAKQLTENNNKLTRARELLSLGDIDENDYKTIKLEC